MSVSLRGKTVAFSGNFPALFGKTAAMAKARTLGAIATNHISKDTDILVTGVDNVGMKAVKARHVGAKIVSANSFLKFVKGGGARKVAAAAATASSKGRVRAVVPSRVLKASQAEAEETSGPMPWEKGSKFHRKMLGIKKAQITRALNAKRAAKTSDASSKISSFVDRTADEAGPMPWEKGSKFHRKTLGIKKAKITRALNAKLKAAQEKKAAKVATAVASAEVTQAVEASQVEAKVEAPVEAKVAPALPVAEALPAITFAPSKGLTVTFAGDFADFCRAANQLVITKQASSATTVVEKL